MIFFLKKGSQVHEITSLLSTAGMQLVLGLEVFWFVSYNERRLSDGCFCNSCNTDFQRHYLYLVFATLGLISLNRRVQTKKRSLNFACRVSNVKNLHLIQNWLKAGIHCTVFSPSLDPQLSHATLFGVERPNFVSSSVIICAVYREERGRIISFLIHHKLWLTQASEQLQQSHDQIPQRWAPFLVLLLLRRATNRAFKNAKATRSWSLIGSYGW